MKCLNYMTKNPTSNSKFEEVKREISQCTEIEGRESGDYKNLHAGYAEFIHTSNVFNNSVSIA